MVRMTTVDWNEVPIGNILTYIEEPIIFNDLAEYVTITVKRRHGGLEGREKLFGHEIKTKKQFRLHPGAFILSRVQCWHAAYAIVPNDIPDNMIASQNYDQFVIAPDIDHRFFWWLSHSPQFIQSVRDSTSGVVIEKVVFNRSSWLKKTIPLPPLDEQRRIVARIEALARRVSEAQRLRLAAVEEAKALFQSHINQILKDKAKSNSWKWSSLPDLVLRKQHAIKRGPFGSHLRKEFFVPIGYKVYEQKHAIYGDFTAGSYYVDEEKFQELKSFEVKPGDLIISCSGTIGKVAIAPENIEPGIINQALLKISLDTSKIDRRFFKLVFESDLNRQEVAAISPGSAMKNIGSVKILKKIRFPSPPLDEQRLIVAYLDGLQSQVDILRRLQAETQSELDALLPSILDKAFKGEL